MTVEPSNAQVLPTPDPILDLLWPGYQLAIVKAGFELQVWAKVAERRRTAREMAIAEGWDSTGTRMLLDALCGMGLLAKDEAGYCLNELAETYLLPGKATYIGDAFLYDLSWEQRGQLSEAVRAGRRPVVDGYTTAEKAEFWAAYLSGRRVTPDRGLEDIDKLWQSVGIEARDGLRILDAACGSGVKSLALARHHPGVRVTLQDWPQTLEVASEVADRLGLAGQVDTLPGDIQAVDFGEGRYDVVWFGNITHYYSREDLVALLRKASHALVPGGMVVINAPVADDLRCERKMPLLGAMEMYVCSAEGDMYTGAEYRDFLEQGGFAHVVEVNDMLIKGEKRE